MGCAVKRWLVATAQRAKPGRLQKKPVELDSYAKASQNSISLPLTKVKECKESSLTTYSR
jgi:hypothetical protein